MYLVIEIQQHSGIRDFHTAFRAVMEDLLKADSDGFYGLLYRHKFLAECAASDRCHAQMKKVFAQIVEISTTRERHTTLCAEITRLASVSDTNSTIREIAHEQREKVFAEIIGMCGVAITPQERYSQQGRLFKFGTGWVRVFPKPKLGLG